MYERSLWIQAGLEEANAPCLEIGNQRNHTTKDYKFNVDSGNAVWN